MGDIANAVRVNEGHINISKPYQIPVEEFSEHLQQNSWRKHLLKVKTDNDPLFWKK